MTSRITKRQRKEQMVAWTALILVAITIIGMLVMGVYTLVISFETQNYTREILQAEQDSISYPEGKRQEYIDSVYVEADANRQAIYDSNAYTQWFFNNINGFGRLVVVVLWFLIPMAMVYIIVKC